MGKIRAALVMIVFAPALMASQCTSPVVDLTTQEIQAAIDSLNRNSADWRQQLDKLVAKPEGTAKSAH
jgi:hypothetical protein